MEELDLVPVYTPEGELKKIKRSDMEKALSSGFSLADQPKPVKQSVLTSAAKGIGGGLVEAGKYLGEKTLESAEDVARLGAQGLTFGFSDEALAAAQAAKEGAASGGDFADLYQKYLALEQEKIKMSKERSPVLGTAAEFGGAILPAIGASVASGGAAAPAAAGGLARILGRAALTGAVGGAVSGAGTSEGTIVGGDREKIAQLGKDIVGGAASGAVLSPVFTAGLMGAGKLASGAKSGLGKLAKTFDEAEASVVAFEESKMGTDFVTKQGKEKLEDRLTNEAKDLTEKIVGVERSLGNELNAAVDVATQNNVKINIKDINPLLQEANQLLSKNKRANASALELLDNMTAKGAIDASGLMGEVQTLSDPRTIKKFRDEIKNQLLITSDPGEQKLLKELQQKLKEKLEASVEGFATANRDFELFRSAAGEQFLNRGLPQYLTVTDPITRNETIERIGRYASDTNNKEYKSDLFRLIREDISKKGRFGTSSDPGSRTFNELRKSLKDFEQQTGRDLSKYNLTPDETVDRLNREAVVQGVKQKVHGYDQGYGEANIKQSLTPDIMKRPFMVQRGLGKIARGVEKISSSDVSKKIFSLPDTALEKLVDQIKDIHPAYSKSLKDALVNKDSYKKNAALFALMQKPDFRNFVPAFFEEESEETPNE